MPVDLAAANFRILPGWRMDLALSQKTIEQIFIPFGVTKDK
jgi:hypothetical protein